MKRFKNLFILSLVLILIFPLVSCTKKTSSQVEDEGQDIEEAVEVFPLTITDFAGKVKL